jgi:hypothetical protein
MTNECEPTWNSQGRWSASKSTNKRVRRLSGSARDSGTEATLLQLKESHATEANAFIGQS